MKLQELLQQYPIKRIKADDGMVVTAETWQEAHDYHRQSQGVLTLFSGGWGIMTGLEVIASDPPDTSVYILPGIALDEAGRTIVLPQPVAYDMGHDMKGQIYLLLNHSESYSKFESDEVLVGAPRHVNDDFSITAQATLPKTPVVELARVQRSSRESVFLDASNPARPGPDEIDLRFRREVGAPREVRLAVSYLGRDVDKKSGLGAIYLAQALNRLENYHVFVEDDVPIGPDIVTRTLAYLVGQGNFELSAEAMNGLRNLVRQGQGTLLIESLDAEAETSFTNFLRAKDLLPAAISPGHRLLTQPYLFTAPPPGFETKGEPKLWVGGGVIFSTYKYGLLWQGERRGKLASREEIRTAVEWGSNIIAYAQHRRRQRA